MISREEVDDCIGLLHPNYIDQCPIYIFNSFREHLVWSVRKMDIDIIQLIKAFRGKTTGMYNSKKKYIHMYAFNFKSIDKRYIKLCIIHTLYHELRHCFQFNHKINKWKGRLANNQFSIDDPNYRQAPIEKDANKFAARMMRKHSEEISRILNVYPDWEVLRD